MVGDLSNFPRGKWETYHEILPMGDSLPGEHRFKDLLDEKHREPVSGLCEIHRIKDPVLRHSPPSHLVLEGSLVESHILWNRLKDLEQELMDPTEDGLGSIIQNGHRPGLSFHVRNPHHLPDWGVTPIRLLPVSRSVRAYLNASRLTWTGIKGAQLALDGLDKACIPPQKI